MGIPTRPHLSAIRAAALALLLAVTAAGPRASAGVAPPPTPDDAAALGGYNVLIADRGNNRLLVVSPQKRILWQYAFKGLRPGHGADDSFFFDGGRKIIASMEYSQIIQILDVASKKVLWEYGEIDHKGASDGLLDFPDDAYVLPNGNVIVADIRNCRLLEISPTKQIVRQAGETGKCLNHAPYLGAPNGDTPLPNGHVLVSTIRDHALVELDENWHEVMRLRLPIHYPSDPQPTQAGNFVIADYSKPGRIIEISRAGEVVWAFDGKGQGGLDRPSLAEELPNGNIIANDDMNHRVIVIDKATKRIVWQYGVTGHPGSAPGYLRIPDGLDVLPVTADIAAFKAAETVASAAPVAAPQTASSGTASPGMASSGTASSRTAAPATAPEPTPVPVSVPAPAPALRRVGAVTRHPNRYVGEVVRLSGFLLKREPGYILFSDEPGGRVGRFDLPVTGQGIDEIQPRHRYHIEGRFLDGGLAAANGNPYHLELSAPPQRAGG